MTDFWIMNTPNCVLSPLENPTLILCHKRIHFSLEKDVRRNMQDIYVEHKWANSLQPFFSLVQNRHLPPLGVKIIQIEANLSAEVINFPQMNFKWLFSLFPRVEKRSQMESFFTNFMQIAQRQNFWGFKAMSIAAYLSLFSAALEIRGKVAHIVLICCFYVGAICLSFW